MDIKEYLNEKLKNNKVADKAKRIIATGLVAGTILTGAGLTACGQKQNMSNEELASGIVEILQNQNEDLELSNQRLALSKATQITIKNALDLLGVSAPDKMERSDSDK